MFDERRKERTTRFLYGRADEKFVKSQFVPKAEAGRPLDTYKFRLHSYLAKSAYFDFDDVPITFKVTPDTLVNLCAKQLDAIPLPKPYAWNTADVCRWLRRYGYPQYQHTFKVNMINGRTLLLLDASALSAMNIKDFDHIRHIAYGIRGLFYFTLTNFGRSISLPPHYYHELYKLFRVKFGWKFESMSRSDLWRKMQLLAENSENLSHWELLERWLAMEPFPKYPVLIGAARRAQLYRCKMAPPKPQKSNRFAWTWHCKCMPPCDCHWKPERDLRTPEVFSCLPNRKPDPEFVMDCPGCMPPCMCKWSSQKYISGKVLTCLQNAFPNKYAFIDIQLARMKGSTKGRPSIRLSVWED